MPAEISMVRLEAAARVAEEAARSINPRLVPFIQSNQFVFKDNRSSRQSLRGGCK